MLRQVTKAHVCDMICAFLNIILTIALNFSTNGRMEVIFDVSNVVMHIRFRMINHFRLILYILLDSISRLRI